MLWSQHSRTQVILVFCVLQIEDLRTELQRKEQELMQMQAKMKTVEEQHADYQKHIAVLKESLIAKEEHYNMLQLDVSILWICTSNLVNFSLFLNSSKMVLFLFPWYFSSFKTTSVQHISDYHFQSIIHILQDERVLKRDLGSRIVDNTHTFLESFSCVNVRKWVYKLQR